MGRGVAEMEIMKQFTTTHLLNLESYFVYDKFGLKIYNCATESLKSASVTDNHMIQDLIDKLTRRKTNKFIIEELVYKYYEQVSEDTIRFKEDGVWAKAFQSLTAMSRRPKQNTSN